MRSLIRHSGGSMYLSFTGGLMEVGGIWNVVDWRRVALNGVGCVDGRVGGSCCVEMS